MYRENERHPLDDRILIVKNIDDLMLWKDAEALGINGIICPYPENKSILRAAAHEFWSVSKDSKEYALTLGALGELEAHLDKDQVNETIKQATQVLSNIYAEVTEFPSFRAQIRVNDVPQGFHTHEDSISLTFNREGTIVKALSGMTYPIDAGDVLLFDQTIEHTAPAYEDAWEVDPRVSLII